VAEIYSTGSSWGWARGYVYSGSGLLAIQQQSAVFWVHEDPITKSKRITNNSGVVTSSVELDPWGADPGSGWSSNSTFQPRKFTTYDHDGNGSDEAMFRRYNRWHSRFDQPDSYDGGYNLTNPQSFNRYSYVQNDPVNFNDPFGLDPEGALGTLLGPIANMGPSTSTVTVRIPSEDFEIETGLPTLASGVNIVGLNPQTPTTINVALDANRLEGLMNDTLKYGDCAEYITRLINKAAEQTGKPLESTDIMGLFEKIKSQPNGGIFFDRNDVPGHPEVPPVAGGGGWAWGWYPQGNAMINIYTLSYYSDNPRGAGRIPYAYGERGVHEVIHLSARGGLGYNEAELTKAARALEPDGTFVDWDGALKNHCMPPQFK